MYPSDKWLEILNFYLIVNSGGDLLVTDFSDERLYQAYRENPGQGFEDMDATAVKLALEFQAKQRNTGTKTRPIFLLEEMGQDEETPNGSIPISLPHLSDHV